MSKKPTSPTASSKAFIAAAKAAEADTDESRWEARLKAVAKPPAGSKVVVGRASVLTPADLKSGAYDGELAQMRRDIRSFDRKKKPPAKPAKKGK
jgi:hypothetical protein